MQDFLNGDLELVNAYVLNECDFSFIPDIFTSFVAGELKKASID
jgi:hypothetical protein